MSAWATSFNLFPSYLHTVCIDGRCFNLYDVVSSKAKNDLAQIAQELKEKDTVNMEKREIFLIIGQISEQILSYDFFHSTGSCYPSGRFWVSYTVALFAPLLL